MDLRTESRAAELRVLGKLSWPVISTNLLSFTLVIAAQVVLGHLGPRSLAAAALGNSYWNMAWFFLQGASTALDTLASQAYGSGDTELVRLWAWRSVLLLSAFLVPITVLLFWSEDIMVFAFRLPPALCAEAAIFVRWLIPGTWCFAWFQCVQKYQQSQNVMLPSVLVGLLANVVNVTGMLVLVHYWGFVGAPVALSLTRCAMLAALLVHARCTPAPRPPPGTEAPVFKKPRRVLERPGLALLARMGLAGGLMMALEACSFEAMTVFAGQVSDLALDAHNILLTVAGFCFLSFPLGISIAATIRVGNLIGAGDGPRARRAAVLSIILGASFMSATGLVMFLLRDELAEVFSDNLPVVRLTARLTPIASLFAVVDGFQGVFGGVFRGLGRQGMIAYMNVFSFWIVAVPVGYSLCFFADFGVFGLWWGLFAGLGALASIYGVLWRRLDWDWEASKAALTAKLLREDPNASPKSNGSPN